MNENNYFKILKIFNRKNKFSFIIQNKLDKNIELDINSTVYNIALNSIIETELIDSNKIVINVNNEDTNFQYDMEQYNKLELGFGPDTLIETKDKPIKINEINNGDFILDSTGNSIIVKNVIVSIIDKSSKPILIKKSKCGINLPYSDIIMSTKNNLKIKKVVLKGKSLFLNGKAKIYKLSDTFPLYSIETEGKKDFLLNGFIVESI